MVIRMDAINLKETIEPSLDNDKLGIKEQHDSTINLILGITGSATIAITSQYGGGKTFFAKCLENTLKNEHKDRVNTVYVDLWSNDYKNPLATFISSLDSLDKDNNRSMNMENLKNIAVKVLPVLSFVANIITQIPTDKAEEVLKNLLNGKDKENIDDLKKEIKKLAKDKKLVFLVDEIDRCRPEYAIETLETIKHFFELDNIIFILFINPSYIDNIENQYIKYGIGSHGYMEKFVDKTILLDIPAEKSIFLISYDNYYLINGCISILIEYFSLSARDILQISKNISLFYKFYPRFKSESYYNLFYLFFMYALKSKNLDCFKEITSLNGNQKHLKKIINQLKTNKKNKIPNPNSESEDEYNEYIENNQKTIQILEDFSIDILDIDTLYEYENYHEEDQNTAFTSLSYTPHSAKSMFERHYQESPKSQIIEDTGLKRLLPRLVFMGDFKKLKLSVDEIELLKKVAFCFK